MSELNGVFLDALKRTNSKIKEDRAIAISEEAELVYKRKVEDMEVKIKRLKRDRENMLDMSPTNATSLIVASDFNADEFVDKDIEIGLKIRDLEIMLEIAASQYKKLFTGDL